MKPCNLQFDLVHSDIYGPTPILTVAIDIIFIDDYFSQLAVFHEKYVDNSIIYAWSIWFSKTQVHISRHLYQLSCAGRNQQILLQKGNLTIFFIWLVSFFVLLVPYSRARLTIQLISHKCFLLMSLNNFIPNEIHRSTCVYLLPHFECTQLPIHILLLLL